MVLQGKSFIGFQSGTDEGLTFSAFNPVTGKQLEGSFSCATVSDVKKACELAAEAFPVFNVMPAKQRAEFLFKIADEVEASRSEIEEMVCNETGYPAGRAQGELNRTTGQLRMFANLLKEGSWVSARIDTAIPDRQPLPKPDIRQSMTGLGPVAVFAASNFPQAFSTAGGDTASAFAAGCPVVVKGHSMHPGTSELYAKAIIKAARDTNMPEGVFSLLQGRSHDLGKALVNNPNIKAVGFTGSLGGGMALQKIAVSRPEPIPVFAEMSSSNPVVMLPEILEKNSKELAEGFLGSLTLGAGQFCTGPGIVFVIKSPGAKKFSEHLKSLIAESAAGTAVHPSIKKNYDQALHHKSSLENVAILSRSHKSGACEETDLHPGILFTDAKTYLLNKKLEEEIFGPACLLVECEDQKQLHEIVSSFGGHLTASVHGSEADLNTYSALIPALSQKTGRLIVNGYPTGVEVCPSMHHGGPFPSTTDSRSTSVGTAAINRFLRPVCYQNVPQALLPDALKNENPLDIWRLVNGEWTKDKI